MKRTIFRPRYTIKSLLDVLLLSLGLLFSLSFRFMKVGIDPFEIFGSILFIGFVFWWLHLLIRRIVFTPSAFIVERYIWPSKTIEYGDVVDLGETRMKTRKGEVILAGMSNAPELLAQFTKLIEQGEIDQKQIENKVVQQDAIFRKSIIPTLIVSFILWVLVLYFWPYHHPLFDSLGIWLSLFGLELSLFVIFLLVALVAQWIIKKAG